MKLKHVTLGLMALGMSAGGFVGLAQAELKVVNLSYRTGPFAANGIQAANGVADYFTMLNERDGGIGGVKINLEECETGYNAQKGVECYEATKDGALVYIPNSTGITLQLIPKAPVDKTVIFSSGYGLSASSVGEKFPWTFNAPTSYWGQASAILRYIDVRQGGDGSSLATLKGKKIGFIFLDVGYGREPLPLLRQLSEKYGYELMEVPVGVKEMQNQSSHWLTVRKEKPDWMIMWGWGAMNASAIGEAIKIRYPMDKFIGNWWSSAHVDTKSAGKKAAGYIGATMNATGKDFPAMKDIVKHVVSKGKSQADPADVGNVLYSRGVLMSVLIAEGIRAAQEMSGKSKITAADFRKGLENLDITEARLAELGLANFTNPIKTSCADHEGGHPVLFQQWDGSDWNPIAGLRMPVMSDVVRPMLEKAADDYVAAKPGWETQNCN